MKIRQVTMILLGWFILAACGSPAPENPQIEIQDAWVRAAPMLDSAEGASGMELGASTSAAYMVMRNAGQQADTLLSVATDIAEVVELHTTETRNGVTMMSAVKNIEVPGRGKAELKPGGLHIMLIKLNQELVPGQTVTLRLNFQTSGEISIEAEVREP